MLLQYFLKNITVGLPPLQNSPAHLLCQLIIFPIMCISSRWNNIHFSHHVNIPHTIPLSSNSYPKRPQPDLHQHQYPSHSPFQHPSSVPAVQPMSSLNIANHPSTHLSQPIDPSRPRSLSQGLGRGFISLGRICNAWHTTFTCKTRYALLSTPTVC